MQFRDRTDAGRRLAELLGGYRSQDVVVVGLPRGGVPVAAEVARALDAPLDVLVVRKLGCPWQPELGMGAIGEGGVTVLNPELIGTMGLGPEEVEAVTRRERAELDRRVKRYRGDRPPEALEGRTVVLVDDGIATGFTVRAAIEVLRRRGVRRVVVAVPVAPPREIEVLRGVADEVAVVEAPPGFLAIGQFYADFAQTSDDEVVRLLAAPRAEPAPATSAADDRARAFALHLGTIRLAGDLTMPARPAGIVVFAHGSGSGRHSPRNRSVAHALNRGGFATLLLDLLTAAEELDRSNVFDVGLLAERLAGATRWLRDQPETRGLPLGYFGAGTGAAAALWAAADLGDEVGAVVSRGGRPDLAGARLAEVRAPTLLIVGSRNGSVLELNSKARAALRCDNALEVVPEATHLFEEPGALDRVAALTQAWFARYLLPKAASPRRGSPWR